MSYAILAFPRKNHIRLVRRRVTEHDFDMYAAIAGKRPEVGPAPDAKSDPKPALPAAARPQAGAALPVRKPQRAVAVRATPKAPARPWSPTVLGLHLRQICYQGLRIRVRRPEVSDWVRRLSDQAVEKFQEAQARLASANARRPAAPHSAGPEDSPANPGPPAP